MNAQQTPIAPEVFTAAAEHEDAALAAYQDARARRDEAERALHALSCRAPFTYDVPGPDPEDVDDVYVIEENCTRTAGHAGEHRGDHDSAATAEPAYVLAVARFDEANVHAGDELARWEDAEEDLDALRCNHRPGSVWPCVQRRGHDGEHVHPSEMRLVL